jgi:flavin-dependent halogenase
MNIIGERYDVVVIGGGPGGAATAGLLAQRGHSVLVLEREKFPRYHIGESLITGCLPTLEELGVRDRLDGMGFTKKYGGTLLWGKNQGTWGFRFAESSLYDYAYQVRRADFDALLLGRARELGAHVVEEATVKQPVLDDGRVVGVSCSAKGGEPAVVHCRMLVDASGQQNFLGRTFGLVGWHEDLRNIAVWAYFEGCQRYGGTRAGDIISENRPSGWFWFIPLHDGTVSIGYVTPIVEYQASGLTLAELFETQLAQAQEVQAMTAGARRASGYRTIKDWSYTNERFHGPGWVSVGDAAAFVDPLLSTGVTLAMRGARNLVSALDAILADPSVEDAELDRYESGYRVFLDSVLEFVRFFYDRTKHKEEYWDKAQQTIDPDRLRPRETDFATLLSGLTGLNDFQPLVDASRAKVAP